MISTQISTIVLASFSLIVPALAFCGHGIPHIHKKVYKRQEGEAEAFQAPLFGYDTTRGPLQWHTLDPEFSTCVTGTSQSPIQISNNLTRAISGSVRLDLHKGANVKFENLGTTVEVAAKGTMNFADGTETGSFNLAQFHFHTPSEHRIGVEHFDGEMHMVHTAVDNPEQIAVVSFLLESSADRTTDVLEAVMSHLGEIKEPGASVEIPELNFQALVDAANTRNFFRYSGSLTTPPCSEGVSWFIADRPLEINANTFQALRRTVGMNNRFTQTPADTKINILAQSFLALPEKAGLVVAAGPQALTNSTASASAEVSTHSSAALQTPSVANTPAKRVRGRHVRRL